MTADRVALAVGSPEATGRRSCALRSRCSAVVEAVNVWVPIVSGALGGLFALLGVVITQRSERLKAREDRLWARRLDAYTEAAQWLSNWTEGVYRWQTLRMMERGDHEAMSEQRQQTLRTGPTEIRNLPEPPKGLLRGTMLLIGSADASREFIQALGSAETIQLIDAARCDEEPPSLNDMIETAEGVLSVLWSALAQLMSESVIHPARLSAPILRWKRRRS